MIYKIEDVLSVLSESTLDDLYTEFDLYSEGTAKEKFVSGVQKAKNKASEVAHSEKFTNATKKVNNAINYVSDKAANKIAGKKPDANASPEIQNKFQTRVVKIKAIIKGGLTAGVLALCPKPFDIVATPILFGSIMKSDDPSDKLIAEKVNTILSKVKELKSRVNKDIEDVKNNKITEDEFRRRYDAATLQGMNYAKELDALKAKANKGQQPVTESVDDLALIDKLLVKEDGTMVENAFTILTNIVEKTDYTKYDICDVVADYIQRLY